MVKLFSSLELGKAIDCRPTFPALMFRWFLPRRLLQRFCHISQTSPLVLVISASLVKAEISEKERCGCPSLRYLPQAGLSLREVEVGIIGMVPVSATGIDIHGSGGPN